MISLPPTVKIFLSTAPADMRKSFDGLAALVEHVLQEDPLSGHLFVFRNRRGDRVKLLYWDRDGLCIVHIDMNFESVGDKRVLVVKCDASNLPVYLTDGTTEQFYVRTGAATTELRPSEIQGYLKQRF